MKAVLCKTLGPAGNLVLEEVASPLPKNNEILLDVQAAGVNFPDTLIIEGKYQFQPPLPFSPGGEAAGVVAAVGEKAGAFKVGDRVMALTGWGRLPSRWQCRSTMCCRSRRAWTSPRQRRLA